MSHDMLHVTCHGSISGRTEDFSLLQNRLLLATTLPPTQWVPWVSRQGVKLITHLQLVPGLRVSGAIPLLHPYA